MVRISFCAGRGPSVIFFLKNHKIPDKKKTEQINFTLQTATHLQNHKKRQSENLPNPFGMIPLLARGFTTQ